MSKEFSDLQKKAEAVGLKLSVVLPLQELRKANVERCETSFKHSINDWSPAEWAMATTGELGELCNLLKKRHRGEEINQKDIADEIADTLIYLDLLAACLGIDLTEAVISKFNEVSIRVGSDIRIGEY